MPDPLPDPAPSRRNRWHLVIPAAVAFAYVFGHLAWYRHTPLGQVPVLDEQENLAFAEAIFRDALPREPFYRAPGYALSLALLRLAGVPAAELFHAALVLGAALHALNAALVAQIARQLFRVETAGLIAGLLYALHPVFVHYSTQVLDAVPALTFFLLGLALLTPTFTATRATPAPSWRWATASLSWATAAMFRPNYLMVWVTLPVLAAWAFRQGGRRSAVPAACTGAMIFAAIAAWQGRVSGEVGFLPSQGPYNLWAANRPGTHGRYYVQQHSFPSAVAAQNPARAESIYLFYKEKGSAPADIATLNAHWRTRFFDHVSQHPLVWLQLLVRKAYALLNDWEQYNNKTFAFHQARSPWLSWNPLGWGLLFVLAFVGAARLGHESPMAIVPVTLIGVACAASVVLFFVSARFRLPLAALTTMLAGGALAAPRFWRGWHPGRQLALGIAAALAAAVTFSTFDDVRSRVTFVQDHTLLARAADAIGDDDLTWSEASAALALQPMHQDALRLAVASYFNRLVLVGPLPEAEASWREICRRFLRTNADDARDLQAVAALGLWRAGDAEAALNAWRALSATPSALAARLLLSDVTPAEIDATAWKLEAWNEPLVRLAALRVNLPPPAGIRLGDPVLAVEITRRIFAPPTAAGQLP